jgi:hypothetical protein
VCGNRFGLAESLSTQLASKVGGGGVKEVWQMRLRDGIFKL